MVLRACSPAPALKLEPAPPAPERALEWRDPCSPPVGGRERLQSCEEQTLPRRASRAAPAISCRGWRAPRVVCEAANVYPFEPVWRVFYPGTEDVVDLERGVVVYLTVAVGRFARFEACITPDYCLAAWGGYFGGRALFHK